MRAIRDLGTDSVPLKAVIAVMENFGVGELSNDDREAMDMELYLKAYFKVAKKRFIDNVPMLLELHLVRPYMAEVKAKMMEADNSTLANVLVESNAVVVNRARLHEEFEALNRSKRVISEYSF
jgi:Dynamin GTPase effector domain